MHGGRADGIDFDLHPNARPLSVVQAERAPNRGGDAEIDADFVLSGVAAR